MNFKALDRYLDTFYDEKNVPGLGITVYRYGKHLHTYCAGFANVEKKLLFADDTIFNLYSATKISTCTAGMRLVERGLLNLDDPVKKYLPEMGRMKVRQECGEAVPAQNIMRIRHLFSMSAGFSYERDAAVLEPLMERTNGGPSTREVAEALSQTPLLFEPGTRFKYSFCHDVLGAVLETVCEDSLGNILKKNLFDPMEMRDTAFKLDEEKRVRLAPEYYKFNSETGTAERIIYREGVDMEMGPVYESGGGGLMSSVRDYGKLAAMLANGGAAPNGVRILKSETIALMQKNQLTREGLLDFSKFGNWSKAGYGYGLGVRTLMDRERNNALSENGEFGWDGALGCYLAADPRTGIAIFYAQQEGGSKWSTYHGTVRNFAYACVLGSGDEDINGMK